MGPRNSVIYRWCAAGAGLAALLSWQACAGVTAVEAYSVPIGAAAIVIGRAAQRRTPALSSWAVYGPGLSVLLGASLLATIDGTLYLRVVLLTIGALIAVTLGARFGLQAPIVLGAGTLLVLAIDAGAPVANEIPAGGSPSVQPASSCCGLAPHSSGGSWGFVGSVPHSASCTSSSEQHVPDFEVCRG